MIILPKHINILCEKNGENRICNEYSLYYRNFIWPFRDEDILRVICDYGMDLGDCWRIEEIPTEIQEFPLELIVYSSEGTQLERASTTVTLTDRAEAAAMRIALIGDSMTHHGTYGEVLAESLPKLSFIGTRNVTGHLVEGRGGWTLKRYLTQKEHYLRGISPFMFPENESAEAYYGDWDFWRRGYEDPESDSYVYGGFQIKPIEEGESFIREGKLYRYRKSKEELIDENPVFRCDYKKYLKHFNLKTPDAVSFLFGANEMQKVPFDRTYEVVQNTINNFKTMIAAVREANPTCKIIINLPIMGAEQYAWGKRLGCNWSGKQYHFNILKLCEAILGEFDNKEEEGYFISPALLAIDPVYGFQREEVRVNKNVDITKTVQTNWVHPCEIGYRCIGEALAGTVAYISKVSTFDME